ncbi:MAG: hypothetical protein Q4A58_08060 [Fusobacterium sp.]|uniref:hypothetical protein n=1 Tax=Fusobacterium sp. TaxID=68766 RepID=UPI0026DD2350|nr:hypothetical protein [Fusobacterium sp.]MDO4691231.1 hypothetical protein [Fusobacterium sp.]
MKGKGLYFRALKEDFIESIKEVEKKLGGLQYVLDTIYEESKLKIYNSIEELPNIGTVKSYRDIYMIGLKKEEFYCREIELIAGGISYRVGDEKGILQFIPSGVYEGTNCVIRGELSTVAETESRQLIFKELKKAMLKNMMIAGGGVYIGKSIIKNKEKYRLPYGSPSSPPEYDLDISDLVWIEKGRKKK